VQHERGFIDLLANVFARRDLGSLGAVVVLSWTGVAAKFGCVTDDLFATPSDTIVPKHAQAKGQRQAHTPKAARG